jgi:putative transposase
MDEYQSLSHTKWECKYHVVFIPKCRRKALYGQLRQGLGSVFRKLAEQKECSIEQGHIMRDHVHMLISIPPKYPGRGPPRGGHFWARGYFVSTVGRDEVVIREYIRNQEAEDKRLEQLSLTK